MAPYAPIFWSLGGIPEPWIDIPVSDVFLVLFIGSAIAHMTIFQTNRRKGHKFLFSAMLFGFSMARIVTMILRIASAAVPNNISLAIAAQIFTYAGVVVIFVVNLVFAQRIIRAGHPRVGWHPLGSLFFKACYFLIVTTVIVLIVAVVQSYYTLDPDTHRIDRALLLYGATMFAVLSLLPIPLTIYSLLIPRRKNYRLDKFGSGKWRTKPLILLTGATLISFGACYRAGTSWLPLVPQFRPLPAVLGKAPFYIAQFTVEILTSYLYAATRVDQRFHVPDNAKPHKNYARAAAHNARPMQHMNKEIARPDSAYTESDDALTDLGSQPNLGKERASRPTSGATWETINTDNHV